MISEWQAISARIDALFKASEVYTQVTAAVNGDAFGVYKMLQKEATAIFQEISRFSDQFTSVPA